ncbi:Rv2993c-like domain-containing protein [Actinomadura madurae]|uniref:Rv2993c-like domain-containing protein n=1 Tax=Actinomadura madurae TaxID=1993 RepID=UPI0020D234D4|nr:Rv2993c-like domain-containing protein [Actinomadura madurae]MCP9977334.1 DUF2437 domain-containing protein [Actinomadura madurae]
MRLATYAHLGLRRCGIVDGDAVEPFPLGTELLDIVRSGPLPQAAELVPLREVRLLPPIEPPSVRDFVTFEEHVEGVRRSVSGGGRSPGRLVRRADLLLLQPARDGRRP